MNEYCNTPLPLVNESNMKNYINRYVIIHGKVNSVKNNSLFLSINQDTNTDIIVKNFNQNVRVGSNIKIIGKVFNDLSLDYLDMIPLTDDFDLKLLNEMIPIINHKEVSSMFM
jgi:hypothetical protein